MTELTFHVAMRTTPNASLGLVPTLTEVVLAWRGADSLGASDCELVRDAILAQPVAALSSLGYVVAGGWLVWAWRDLPPGERAAARGYGGLLVLVGAGSVLYHGPQGPAAELLHDLPVVLVLAEAIAVPTRRAVRRRPVLRAGLRNRLLLTGTLAALAVAAYGAGRTGSPLCDPHSLMQPHGLWHLSGAAALALWGTALWPAPADPESQT